jgi:hypothetical protein
MKIDKRLLMVGLAVAVTAFAVTASSASASVWKDKNGTKVESKIELGLSGGEVFTIGESGMSCELHATLTTSGGSTGTITAFETKKCVEGFGEFTGCELASAEPKNLPWTVDVNTSDLTITNWKTRRTFKTGCPFSVVEKTLTSVTVTLETVTEITTMEFLGEITGYKTIGSFSVDSPNSGTYGIG